MSPFAFGPLIGNEDMENWTKFWKFVKRIHPCIDAPTKTILTDQDKELIAAFIDILQEAAQFYCLF
jgi:hypothetical protein